MQRQTLRLKLQRLRKKPLMRKKRHAKLKAKLRVTANVNVVVVVVVVNHRAKKVMRLQAIQNLKMMMRLKMKMLLQQLKRQKLEKARPLTMPLLRTTKMATSQNGVVVEAVVVAVAIAGNLRMETRMRRLLKTVATQTQRPLWKFRQALLLRLEKMKAHRSQQTCRHLLRFWFLTPWKKQAA